MVGLCAESRDYLDGSKLAGLIVHGVGISRQ